MEKIVAALLEFQSKNIVIPKKSKINIKFKKEMSSVQYSYAKLEDILAIINPILSSLNLVLYHQIDNDKIVTVLHHKSGEYIKSVILIPENLSPQQLGSFITYMRRYSITAMLNLSCDDDDDGTLAEINSKNQTKTNLSMPPAKKTNTTDKTENKTEQKSYVFNFNGNVMNELEFIAEMKDCVKFPEYSDFVSGEFDELLLFIYCIDLIKDGRKDEVKEHTDLLSEDNKAILREIYKDPNHRLLKLRA